MLPEWLSLAGPALQSLRLNNIHPLDGKMSMPHFNAMTALTRLELLHLKAGAIEDVKPLHKLPLVKLIFSCCGGLVEKLFVPGVWPSLKTVHLQEDPYQYPKPADYWDDNSSLTQLHSTIFNLPSLVELLGQCDLFAMDIPVGWKLWRKCHPSCGPISSPYGGTICRCWSHTWRKVL